MSGFLKRAARRLPWLGDLHRYVVALEAALLDYEDFGSRYLAVVEFSGLIRESAEKGETPFKELFLARNRDRLQIPFVMGVGGAVDILGGVRRRAPGWMQRLGLEWAYRLAQDPRRLARRYIVGNTWFTWLVARELVRQRVLPSSAARGRDAA